MPDQPAGQPRPLYAAVSAYDSGFLDVGDGHEVYYEQSGNPAGKPVVFLHGGPGGGCSPLHRRFFDPARYRAILFDQRGCGKSRPYSSLDANTTQHLVHDIECLREHFGIHRWQVFGGSWGSTLALVYAETYPARVTELVLRGIFLGRQDDIDWFYKGGTGALFPEAYADFLAPIPEAERGDLITAYYRRLTDPDPENRREAAVAWSLWEGRTVSLQSSPGQESQAASTRFADAIARIECHYFRHDCFLEDNQILRDVDRLASIPTTIIHGRYDVICAARAALALSQAMPHADFYMAPLSGHSAFEVEIRDALIAATDTYAAR